jgi:gamma-glutamylcyclotransferase (GGCT)/AIG2-like uncharacterized protein YtfP
MSKHYVFGYGTLQHSRDFSRFDAQLTFLGAEYVGDGVLRDHMIARIQCYWQLWAGVVRHEGGYVQGEVFRVDEAVLGSLDRRESYKEGRPDSENVYKRELKQVGVNGELVEAWVYTVDHNPKTIRERLSHSWPVAGDPLQYIQELRTHEPLAEENA